MSILSDCLAEYRKGITGCLYLGAHTGQEAPLFVEHGINNVCWVEANPELIPRLEAAVIPLGHKTAWRAIWHESGVELPFHVSNKDGSSSSLLDFRTHRERYPSIEYVNSYAMPTITVDDLARHMSLRKMNLLVMDLQGAEGHALQGSYDFLEGVDFICTEINFEEVYQGCYQVADIEACLPDFTCRAVMDTSKGWGEALYVRQRQSALDLLSEFRR